MYQTPSILALQTGIQKPPPYSRIDPSHPLSRGLSNCWLLGDGVQAKQRDSFRKLNTITMTGLTASPYRAGRFGGRAFNFDGAATFGQSASNISIGSAFTVSVWVLPDGTQASFARIADTAFDTAFFLGSDAGGTEFSAFVNNTLLDAAVGFTVGAWHHVVLVYDGTNATLYVNGAQTVQAAATAPNTNLPLFVGRDAGAASSFWDGAIENLRYYNRALSFAERRALGFEQPFAGFVDDFSSIMVAPEQEEIVAGPNIATFELGFG